MILKEPNETTLDAIERIGRTYSVNPLILGHEDTEASIAFIYELIGALASEAKRATPRDQAKPEKRRT
jgi:hypothetical protein